MVLTVCFSVNAFIGNDQVLYLANSQVLVFMYLFFKHMFIKFIPIWNRQNGVLLLDVNML